MLVKSVINKPIIQRKSRDLFTLSRQLVKIAKDKPLATSGTVLTLLSFLTVFLTKAPLKLMPFFGIPAIGLIALEIFSGKHPDEYLRLKRKIRV